MLRIPQHDRRRSIAPGYLLVRRSGIELPKPFDQRGTSPLDVFFHAVGGTFAIAVVDGAGDRDVIVNDGGSRPLIGDRVGMRLDASEQMESRDLPAATQEDVRRAFDDQPVKGVFQIEQAMRLAATSDL